ncbi:hypothetical protein B0T10DRAFT_496563 [Thelonectria olida]|uniref:Uncharacterized protein n=1 Tax=Thelonectria olida TaxID=1576542 RepID=A0A9P9AH58_9HYPO|nr:hypothetical protein B0T10DRAFT_496563 [Thelonectria olida]
MVREGETGNVRGPSSAKTKDTITHTTNDEEGGIYDGQSTIAWIVAAWSSTIGSNVVIRWLQSSSTPDKATDQSCWARFPACNPRTVRPPPILPSFLHRAYTCELLLGLLALLTLIHWAAVVRQFRQGRWRERYLSATVDTALLCLITAAFLVGDATTLLLRVLPIISDICMLVCLSLERQSPRG